MEANDMIFYEDKDEKIYAGGFSINSIMMKNGISPIITLNNPKMESNNVSDLFNNLVVPNWAFYLPTKNIYGGNGTINSDVDSDIDEDTDIIDDDLHNKLLDLVKPEEIKRAGKKMTRKERVKNNIPSNKKKTKKNKLSK
jgi:hypothetical protein